MIQIYKVTNRVNGKIYIGQTSKGMDCRWERHIDYAQRGGSRMRLARAIRKYGPESFEMELLAIADSKEQGNFLERKHILEMRSFDPKIGYNCTFGGDGGFPTPETRAKISVRTSKVLKGKPKSEKQRQAISASRLGYKCSEEHRLAISIGHLGLKKKICKYGHPFDDSNAYFNKKTGKRQCKTCTMNRYYRAKEQQNGGPVR